MIRLRGADGRRAQLPVDEAISIGRLLSDYVELQQVATRKQIQTMAEHTRCPVTRPKLGALLSLSKPTMSAAIAEQRLLWHLGRVDRARLFLPDDLAPAAARDLLQLSLRADFEKHRRWLVIDGLLALLSVPLTLIPGPNVPALYFGFRFVNPASRPKWRQSAAPMSPPNWRISVTASSTKSSQSGVL